jgi:hypothetical protein
MPASSPDVVTDFDPDQAWRKHPQVALREETFGALAYHYGNRRLIFLKSPELVVVVRDLENHPSARAALDALIPVDAHGSYERALARLVESEVICGA